MMFKTQTISWAATIIIAIMSITTIESKSTTKRSQDAKAPVKITLDDVLTSKYSARGWGGTWVSDDLIQRSVDGHLVRYHVEHDNYTTILDTTQFNATTYPGSSFSFSPDEQFVLITHSTRSLWRHSFLAKYHIHDVAQNVTFKLLPDQLDENENEELQLVKWSPSPTGSSLIFIYGGNIYYRQTANSTTSRQLTQDGDNVIITNGHTDWVYEEEMFGDNTAAWFSPDSRKLAYIKFNDTEVAEFQYPMYGEASGRNENNSYPSWVNIRYPKPGTTNPTVSLHIVDLFNLPMRTREVNYPTDTDLDLRHYIAKVQWKNDVNLMVIHLNRHQQNSSWFNCDTTNGDATTVPCTSFYSFQEPNGWIDIGQVVFSAEADRFLTTKFRGANVASGPDYKHIVVVNVSSGQETRINNGNYSVDSILKWVEDTNTIYFSGTGFNDSNAPDPSQNQIYSIAIDGSGLRCISCSLPTSNNEVCLSNSMSFNPAANRALHVCSGPNVPETVLRQWNNTAWAILRVMQNNSALRTELDSVEVPIIRDYEIPSSDGNGLPIRARLFLPANFDSSLKYPLFIDVYGGPGSQNIGQRYSVSWGSSLVSSHEVIYGYIDGRGSGRQTGEHLFELLHVLGTVEIEDQIAAVKYLVETNTFINGSQTAIWGWSYGGYATAMVLAKDTENVFKCGISVAPVTSWFYYDTIYTERYMDTPQSNRLGYEEGNVASSEHIEGFKSHQFFLVHGNADDNVHYQQSMILARGLEKADVMFNQLSYPNEDHSINSAGMRRHLYHSLEKFLFRDCFLPRNDVDDGNNEDNGSPSSMSVSSLGLAWSLATAVLMRMRIAAVA